MTLRDHKPPRERAARALCEFHGKQPDQVWRGTYLWRSYLPEVDTVLIAAVSTEEWLRIQQAG